MRKFRLLIGLLVWEVVQAQGPQYLGTKTPYRAPAGEYAAAPQGYRPVFVNYVGRHGARYLTKAGPDVETLRLLEAADKKHGLTGVGSHVLSMVRVLYEVEKGQYENITRLGAEEQEGIGRRMLTHYPGVFSGRGLDVAVTYKVRTQQSADAFLRAFGAYKGQRRMTRKPDSLDAVLRFYDLSPGYAKYKKSELLRAVFDSLDRDHRTGEAAEAVCERVFSPAFCAKMKAGEKVRFFGDIYDLYSLQYSVAREIPQSVDLGIVFGKDELAWEDFVSGAQDFLEKGPGRDPLGIQAKVAAPLLADFVQTTDEACSGGRDAVLRFTHAEAISPFATLLGIPEASVPAAGIYDYERHWQAARIIPLSSNVQWIVYSNGKAYLVKILLNEREVSLPLRSVGGTYYRWEDLRRYCIQRLRAVGADVHGDMLGYLRTLN
ncbi:MAG: hypothetical protein JST42_18490 [Bacteroidetes bacterium]|nr:hypothetical protein [Bacteroidota bacterium]